MLAINLLPWRDYAKTRQKKFFKAISFLSFITSCIICSLIYHHFASELNSIEKRIVNVTKNSEKYINKPEIVLVPLRNTINHTRQSHDQLKKLLHTMFIYSAVDWDTIEAQKEIIKITGKVNLMALLSSFVNYCEKQFNFTIIIKSIKIFSPFDTIKFQIQINRTNAELKNNGLD